MPSAEGARKARERLAQKYTKEELTELRRKAGRLGGRASSAKFDSETGREAIKKRWEKKDGDSS